MKDVLIGGLAALFVMLCIAAFAYLISSTTCHATAKAMQLEGRYTMFTSCMVKINDMWFPLRGLGI